MSEDSESRALAAAWARLDAAPDTFRAKLDVYRILERGGVVAGAHRIADLHRLLCDPAFDPAPFAKAGWCALGAAGRLPTPDAAGARAAEDDAVVLALLGETSVTVPAAERALSSVRRWLLLSGKTADFPRLIAALCRQAVLNGGAWPFDEDERALIAQGAHPLSPAYLPPRPAPDAGSAQGDFADPTTAAVATQYEGWPYPTWERLTSAPAADRTVALEMFDPVVRDVLRHAREVLVAGCGTGAEALNFARLAPQARITAIDLSATSLAYARARCAGASNIVFRRLDLHAVRDLGVSFDVVTSSGVLHHLPDPEAGGAALVDVLRPGGVLSLLLYSRLARLAIHAARRRIADLLDEPVDDDLIRRVRARLIAAPVNPLATSADFYSLAGAYDLLLHAHEDPFDIARIRRFVETHGLDLRGFVLPGAAGRRYAGDHPHDPHLRDYAALQRAELADPALFRGGMYEFWCAKRG